MSRYVIRRKGGLFLDPSHGWCESYKGAIKLQSSRDAWAAVSRLPNAESRECVVVFDYGLISMRVESLAWDQGTSSTKGGLR